MSRTSDEWCCKKAKEKREKQLNNIDHEETKA